MLNIEKIVPEGVKVSKVNSSSLVAWAYHDETQTLYIQFGKPSKNCATAVYQYPGVPLMVAEEMAVTPSIGSFVFKTVRKFKSVPCELPKEK